MKPKPTNGFSLIELIVVLGVLGLLLVIGSVVYTTLNQTTRDARRKGDIERIRGALEQYKSQNNSYPTAANSLVTAGFMNSLPQDPVTGAAYSYAALPSGCDGSPTGVCSSYLIAVCFESGGTCPPAAPREIGPYGSL